MKASDIKTAAFLDILFEHKNKLYGAYELRKNYPKRLGKSILVTSVLVFLLMLLFSSFSLKDTKKPVLTMTVKDRTMQPPKQDELKPKIEPEKIVAKKEFGTSKAASKQTEVYSGPKYVTNPNLLSKPNLGIYLNKFGKPGAVDPGDFGDGEGEGQERETKDTLKIPIKFQAPTLEVKPSFSASYPGGFTAYANYLQQHLQDEAIEDDMDKKITISFWIETDGALTDITAENTDDEAFKRKTISVFKKMKKWNPEIVNGEPIRVFKVYPITIILPE